MAEWYRAGVSFPDIAQRLNETGVKPCQSAKWTKTSVYDLLDKEGIHVRRSGVAIKVYDRERAYELAYALKLDGRTFAFIADKLNKSRLATWQGIRISLVVCARASAKCSLPRSFYRSRLCEILESPRNELAGYRTQADGKRAYAEARWAVVRAAGQATSGHLASRFASTFDHPLNARDLAAVRRAVVCPSAPCSTVDFAISDEKRFAAPSDVC